MHMSISLDCLIRRNRTVHGLFRISILTMAVVLPVVFGPESLAVQTPANPNSGVPPKKVIQQKAIQPKKPRNANKGHLTGKNRIAAHPDKAAVQTAPAVAPIPLPEPPHWPANERPVEAAVTWDSTGLRVNAANSSLQQILKDVSTATGAKVEGLVTDERVFGAYGPGQARDVLSELLQGSGFNVIMVGDLGQGVPRQILISSRKGGGAQQASNNNQPGAGDDDAEPDDQPPQPQPQPQPGAPLRPGFAPPGPPRTPQQVMQELQERQQQQTLQPANPQN